MLAITASFAPDSGTLSVFGDDLDNDLAIVADADDVLIGGAGNEVLIGNRGNDVMLGGSGNDLLLDGSGHDFCDGGEGFDVLVSRDRTRFQNIESSWNPNRVRAIDDYMSRDENEQMLAVLLPATQKIREAAARANLRGLRSFDRLIAEGTTQAILIGLLLPAIQK